MSATSQSIIEERPEAVAEPTRPVPRMWLLTNAPSPYQAELLSAAAMRDDIELSVRYMRGESPSGIAVGSSAPHESKVLWGVLPEWARDECRWHPRAVWEVIRGRHDLYVLSGLYTSPTFLTCALASLLCRRKYVLWLERPHASLRESNKRSWGSRLVHSIKYWYLKWLLRHAAGVWCIGTQAEREYQSISDLDGATRLLPYCCRIDRYQERAQSNDALRSQHDLVGRFVFLFSGQIIHRKGVDILLKAFTNVRQRHPDAVLLVLGDGPLKSEYAELAQSLGVASEVRFLGHRPQSELPEWFSLANVFVFPSRRDGWGVVLNEACAAGLPIIASAQTGAAHDLVDEGVNGFMLDCEDVDRWAERMTWCLDHRERLASMGESSRQMIEPFSSVAGAAKLAGLTYEILGSDPAKKLTAGAT